MIKIDLYGDWASLLKDELVSFGYYSSELNDPESIVQCYLNLTKRLVSPTVRVIHKSKKFHCPTDLLPGLAQIEKNILCGYSLTKYLSRGIKKPYYNDGLLNHWGIHHLHLGINIEPDGFCERTGPVLFARFDNVAAYLIGVFPHRSWHFQKLVREIHDNWPESISNYRLKGITGLARSLSDDDVKSLRKKNVVTLIDLGDGIVYAPIGGGYATSGISVDVVRESDRCALQIREMEQYVVMNIAAISDEARRLELEFPAEPNFTLMIDNGLFYAVETQCKAAIELGRLWQ